MNMIGIGLQRKDYAVVEKYSKRLLELHPDSVPALEGLAAAAFSRDDAKSAAEFTHRLTVLAADSHDHWFNYGVACQKSGRLAAVEAYNRAAQIRPESPAVHLNLGVAYEQSDKLQEAQAAFERASALLPDRDDLRLQMAWIAERQQHGGEAEQLYAKLVERNPAAETAWFRLGYLRLEREDAQGGAAAFVKPASKNAPIGRKRK